MEIAGTQPGRLGEIAPASPPRPQAVQTRHDRTVEQQNYPFDMYLGLRQTTVSSMPGASRPISIAKYCACQRSTITIVSSVYRLRPAAARCAGTCPMTSRRPRLDHQALANWHYDLIITARLVLNSTASASVASVHAHQASRARNQQTRPALGATSQRLARRTLRPWRRRRSCVRGRHMDQGC